MGKLRSLSTFNFNLWNLWHVLLIRRLVQENTRLHKNPHFLPRSPSVLVQKQMTQGIIFGNGWLRRNRRRRLCWRRGGGVGLTLFQLISLWPFHLSMLSWSLVYSNTLQSILSTPLTAFPHNHCHNNYSSKRNLRPLLSSVHIPYRLY